MSAFIVSNETMHRVVTRIVSLLKEQRGDRAEFYKIDVNATDAAQRIGAILFIMNTDAVNQRYNERNLAPGYRYKLRLCSDIEAFKATECLLYQCNEGDVPKGELFKELATFRYNLAKHIVWRLPDMEKAPWNWKD